jgi:Chlorophyll A-B binding protein
MIKFHITVTLARRAVVDCACIQPLLHCRVGVACITDFLALHCNRFPARCAHPQHGRIAMLAIVGLVVAQFVRLPGDIYQGVSVVEAHNAMVEKGPMVQLLFWLSLFEILTAPLVWNMDAKVSQQASKQLLHVSYIVPMRACHMEHDHSFAAAT